MFENNLYSFESRCFNVKIIFYFMKESRSQMIVQYFIKVQNKNNESQLKFPIKQNKKNKGLTFLNFNHF